jgi:hypothetical protein
MWEWLLLYTNRFNRCNISQINVSQIMTSYIHRYTVGQKVLDHLVLVSYKDFVRIITWERLSWGWVSEWQVPDFVSPDKGYSSVGFNSAISVRND